MSPVDIFLEANKKHLVATIGNCNLTASII